MLKKGCPSIKASPSSALISPQGHTHGGGFACAVRAEKTSHLAILCNEGHIVDREPAFE
jgi:hypothetical protein